MDNVQSKDDHRSPDHQNSEHDVGETKQDGNTTYPPVDEGPCRTARRVFVRLEDCPDGIETNETESDDTKVCMRDGSELSGGDFEDNDHQSRNCDDNTENVERSVGPKPRRLLTDLWQEGVLSESGEHDGDGENHTESNIHQDSVNHSPVDGDDAKESSTREVLSCQVPQI